MSTRVDRGVVADLLRRARVLSVDAEGTLTVTATDEAASFTVDVLRASVGQTLKFVPGDEVLVCSPADGSRAVVLGRLGPSAVGGPEVPDEIVIEAKKGLVLRVGEGSITLRADGKILIKGKDLVSSAKQLNRIKGGAVSVN